MVVQIPTPNTITYKFDDVIDDIIIATHTQYIGATIQELDAKFHYRESKSYGVHFIDTGATISKRHFRLNLLITLAKTVIPFVKFPESDDIPQLKVSINSYIRSGQSLDADKLASDTGYSKNLFHLYNMIIEIKELLMEGITTTENVQCLFDAVPYEHEGYVMTNDYGTLNLSNVNSLVTPISTIDSLDSTFDGCFIANRDYHIGIDHKQYESQGTTRHSK